jgi:putative membrane protein
MIKMMYDNCMGGGFMGMGYGWLFQILIFVAFFLVVWWVIKSSTGKSEIKQSKPIDILKRRLAKGEITKKQFEELKKEIE